VDAKLPLRKAAASAKSKLNFVFANRYRVTALLGTTSLSQLYWVEDTSTINSDGQDTKSILVLVNPSLLQLENFTPTLARVLLEFTTTLPAVIDSASTSEGFWFVLAVSQGVTLDEQIKGLGRYGLPLQDTLQNAEAILAAVAKTPLKKGYGYLEAASILKTKHQQYFLLNTPIAVSLKILTTGTQTKGKLTLSSSFISPEVAMGGSANEADDTFSLASLIYYMLNGHLPFVLDNSIEAAIKKTVPATVIKLPEHRWFALQRALSYKREPRQTTPETLLFELANLDTPKNSSMKHYALLTALITLLFSAYAIYSLQTSTTADSAPKQQVLIDNQQLSVKDQQADAQAQIALNKKQAEEYAKATEKLHAIQQQQIEAEKQLASLLEQQKQLLIPTVPIPASANEKSTPTEDLIEQQATLKREERLAELEKQQKAAEQSLQEIAIKEQQAAQEQLREQQKQAAQALKEKEAEEKRQLAEQQALKEAEEVLQAEQKAQARQLLQAQEEAQKQQAEQARSAQLQIETEHLAVQQRSEALALQRKQETERLQAMQQEQIAQQAQLQAEQSKAQAAQAAQAEKKRLALEKQQKLQAAQALASSSKPPASQQPATPPSPPKKMASPPPTNFKPHSLSSRPQLVANGLSLAWDNTSLFGSVPTHLQVEGNNTCRKVGFRSAIGFHPEALDENGQFIDGGGYLCH